MSAAAASRDVTLYHAMDTLHKNNYDISKAIASLVPSSGPVLCRDEMEEWSASEANLFEEALDKYGKDFVDIRQDFLPWKSLKSIVEYYYMWKTTDRYVQQKRIKAAEAESKLKQVYIPFYNKPNPAQITGDEGTRACESCYTTQSLSWFAWGPVHMQCRLCASCWNYWKKYGGLKMPTRLERLAQMAAMQRMHRCTIGGCGKEFRVKAQLARHLTTAHGLAIRAGSPRPVMKTRAAFCLITTPLTRISRQSCKEILNIRKAARQPFQPINIALIKQECQMRLPELPKSIKTLIPQKRVSMNIVSKRLKINIDAPNPAFLEHTEVIKEPTRLAFEVRTTPHVFIKDKESPPRSTSPVVQQQASPSMPSILKKRGYDQANGIDGPTVKRMNLGVIRQAGNAKPAGVRGSVINQLNGKTGSNGRSSMIPRNRKTGLSWMDAPDDVFFVATDATRKLRKQMTGPEFKRAARKPWRKLNVKTPFMDPPPKPKSPVVVLE